MNENLQSLHPASQRQHLLRGQDIQLHRISEEEEAQLHFDRRVDDEPANGKRFPVFLVAAGHVATS